MVFRKRTPASEPARSVPEWQQRFDAAADLIRSHSGPAWIEDRLTALDAALRSAAEDDQRLAASIEQLRPDETAAELKQALRRRAPSPPSSHDDPRERQLAALRRRYETVNDLINRRQALAVHVAATVSDLELLAAQAVHASAVLGDDPGPGLDANLARLDIDLQALADARREVQRL